MQSCIFCGIVSHATPAKIAYEDENVIAFHDIHPKAPVHILVCPRKHIPTLNDVSDDAVLVQLFAVARKLAEQFGVHQKGYQTLINVNSEGGQTVFHLHLHVIGGKPLSWP